jgi:predicted N-acetyltransferase YhbS
MPAELAELPTIHRHDGPRGLLDALFRLADDSETQVAAYRDAGEVFVAKDAHAAVLGHIQLIATDEPGVLEIKSLAVDESAQGHGIGQALVGFVLDQARASGAHLVVVSTAAAGLSVLRFYQRAGFRMARIERDAFTPETGYPDGILIEGIPLRDRVWLDVAVTESPSLAGAARGDASNANRS